MTAGRPTPAAPTPAAPTPAAPVQAAPAPRAIVFAYSEVGVRCVRELLLQGVQIPLLFTHA